MIPKINENKFLIIFPQQFYNKQLIMNKWLFLPVLSLLVNTLFAQFTGSPTTIDGATAMLGQFNSLQIIKGKPAISYYEIGNGNLRYISANDANGTTWGTPVILDAMGDVGQFTSLLIVNGEPAISYYDASNEDLKFIRNEPVVVLPIELTLFKAEVVAQTCLLTWQTTQEINTQGFYVQKRTNANANWTDLGFVKAQQKPSIYQFTDENKATKSEQPNTPTYYRLREIRTDGKSSFSKIVSFFSIKTKKK